MTTDQTASALLRQFDDQSFSGFGRKLTEPRNCVLALHVHVLPTLLHLIDRLIELEFRPSNIVVVAKSYSAIRSAVEGLRERKCRVIEEHNHHFLPGRYDEEALTSLSVACRCLRSIIAQTRAKRLILVDDGGFFTETWHRECADEAIDLVSIQQTASGFGPQRKPSKSPYTKIDVARSKAKAEFESRVIAEGLWASVEKSRVLTQTRRVGVVGLGRLGRQVALRLARRAKDVASYDRQPRSHVGFKHCRTVVELLNRADVIFGCTGNNWLRVSDLRATAPGREHQFVSCSSRDVEFQSILWEGRKVFEDKSNSQFGRIRLSFDGGHSALVHNGGFPINFDRQTEFEKPAEIMITRALVLLAILQALYTPAGGGRSAVVALEPSLQRQLVASWLELIKRSFASFEIDKQQYNSDDWWGALPAGTRRLKDLVGA